jgi:hypothetical protein
MLLDQTVRLLFMTVATNIAAPTATKWRTSPDGMTSSNAYRTSHVMARMIGDCPTEEAMLRNKAP